MEDLAKDFWERALANVEAPLFLNLPLTYQPDAKATYEHYVRNIRCPSDTTSSILLQAACSMLISQYTNSCDVVFGARVVEKEEQAIVPVRVRFNWDQSIKQFIESIDQFRTETAPFKHFGLDRICRLNECTEQACQFQLLLWNQLAGEASPDFHSLKGRALTIVFSVHTEGLVLHFQYDEALVDSTEIRGMAFQLGHILKQLCTLDSDAAKLTTKLVEIDTTSEHDVDQVWSWNVEVPQSVDSCIHELIGQVAVERPDSTAVHAWDGVLTYQELEYKSTQLASWLLQSQGLAVRGCMVPILFEKSVRTTITILAIAKAGGAFVALDADQPRSRLLTIMQDLKTTFILCTPTTLDVARTLGPNVCVIDESTIHTATYLSSHLDNGQQNHVEPSGILYAVYTSGSTGTPKGVLISHANLSSAATHQAAALGFNKGARSFDYSSYSFDAYIFNTFYTLITGGCLCVPSDTDRTSDIGAALRAMKVNIAQLTPSVARLIDPQSVPDVHTLILTGEKLNQSDILPWLDHVKVVNAYGPSECTIMCAANTNIIKPTDAHNIGIGLGSVLWIRDLVNNSRLAPIGAIGEVLIEGPIVGQGYLRDEVKTALTQVRHPPWLLKGANGRSGRKGVLFKTGDLGRYNSDGSLTIVGRADAQVKLHGQRIETGEVEYRLRQILPEGYDCVVDVGELAPSKAQQLLCFLQSRKGSHLHDLTFQIMNGLAKVLPRYMIPTVIVPVEKIPMTASGKIDRRTLKRMAAVASPEDLIDGSASQSDGGRKPSTEAELLLEQLWNEILELQDSRIGADDSFFLRGGNSIAAMKLIVAAQQKGYLLTVASIFTKPRLSEMALEMIQRRPTAALPNG